MGISCISRKPWEFNLCPGDHGNFIYFPETMGISFVSRRPWEFYLYPGDHGKFIFLLKTIRNSFKSRRPLEYHFCPADHRNFIFLLKTIINSGSREEDGVGGFFIFSHIRMSSPQGWKISPAGLEPPADACKKEKSYCENTKNPATRFLTFIWNSFISRKTHVVC